MYFHLSTCSGRQSGLPPWLEQRINHAVLMLQTFIFLENTWVANTWPYIYRDRLEVVFSAHVRVRKVFPGFLTPSIQQDPAATHPEGACCSSLPAHLAGNSGHRLGGGGVGAWPLAHALSLPITARPESSQYIATYERNSTNPTFGKKCLQCYMPSRKLVFKFCF